jgi:hypothetical protein
MKRNGIAAHHTSMKALLVILVAGFIAYYVGQRVNAEYVAIGAKIERAVAR